MEQKRRNLTFPELLEKSLHPARWKKEQERRQQESQPKTNTKTPGGRKLPDVSDIEKSADDIEREI